MYSTIFTNLTFHTLLYRVEVIYPGYSYLSRSWGVITTRFDMYIRVVRSSLEIITWLHGFLDLHGENGKDLFFSGYLINFINL